MCLKLPRWQTSASLTSFCSLTLNLILLYKRDNPVITIKCLFNVNKTYAEAVVMVGVVINFVKVLVYWE